MKFSLDLKRCMFSGVLICSFCCHSSMDVNIQIIVVDMYIELSVELNCNYGCSVHVYIIFLSLLVGFPTV